MKKLILIFIAIFAAFVFACKKDDNSNIKPVQLNQPFTLELNQTAELESDGTRIKFLGTTEDSRCPTGMTCFWEGRVVAEFEVDKDGQAYIATLTNNPGNDAGLATSFTVFGHKFKYVDMTPYPDGNPIAQKDYVVTIVIE